MTDISETEISPENFFHTVFKSDPMPPFTFRIELPPAIYQVFLQNFLVVGCLERYNQTFDKLNQIQMEKIREYMWSIGWDYEIKELVDSRIVLDFKENGEKYLREIGYTNNQISFKPANNLMNNYNRC